MEDVKAKNVIIVIGDVLRGALKTLKENVGDVKTIFFGVILDKKRVKVFIIDGIEKDIVVLRHENVNLAIKGRKEVREEANGVPLPIVEKDEENEGRVSLAVVNFKPKGQNVEDIRGVFIILSAFVKGDRENIYFISDGEGCCNEKKAKGFVATLKGQENTVLLIVVQKGQEENVQNYLGMLTRQEALVVRFSILPDVSRVKIGFGGITGIIDINQGTTFAKNKMRTFIRRIKYTTTHLFTRTVISIKGNVKLVIALRFTRGRKRQEGVWRVNTEQGGPQ